MEVACGPAKDVDPGDEVGAAEVIDAIIERLSVPDDSARREVRDHLLRSCGPAEIRFIVDGLLGRAAVGDERAGLALAGFGRRAVPALSLRFVHSRSEAVQTRLLVAAAATIPALTQGERLDLMDDLTIWRANAAGPRVWVAVGEVQAMVRAALGPG